MLAKSTKMCYTYDSIDGVTSRTVRSMVNNSVISTENYTYDGAITEDKVASVVIGAVMVLGSMVTMPIVGAINNTVNAIYYNNFATYIVGILGI